MKTFKKLAVVMAAVMILAGSASAKIVNFGIKAGMNVNHLSFNKKALEDLTDKGNSTGWEAGVMAEFNVPVIGLCFDASLMYARMNNSTQYYFDNNGNKITAFDGDNVGKNFIMLPINIKYKFNLPVVTNYLSPYIFTGPEFAFKLDKNILNEMKTRTCQVAWNIGIGLELINHLQIGASYGFGINNIAKKLVSSDNLNPTDLNIKNNYWTVTAAWLF